MANSLCQASTGDSGGIGERVLLLEHAGSTSVPGLSAKPIIDMVMAVADSADEDAYVPPLEAIGYTLHVREPKWYEHRLIRYSRIAINLHVFSDGCEEIDRMLLFRDWLRSHPKERILYETTKQELAARTWQHVQNIHSNVEHDVDCDSGESRYVQCDR